MKKNIFSIFLFAFLFHGYLLAVPAYRNPTVVRQPDGTPLTVTLHGDEFLSWKTSGASLVALGDDGYYYYASFDSDGNSVPSSDRVGLSSSLRSVQGIVAPPQSAIEKARAKRADAMMKRRTPGKLASSGASSIQMEESTAKTKFLVILVDFKDRKFTAKGGGATARQLFDDMLNKQGFSEYGSVGSVADYYRDNSCNQFMPEFDVYGPYTVDENASTFTADNDGRTQNGAPLLLAKACTLADSDIDFSLYDHDNDGYIDNVNMIFAGYSASEGADNAIWPHSWAVYSKSYYFDGVRLYDYSCSAEFEGTAGTNIDGIGTFCHEFGHILGLPDFYDTDYSENGQATDLEEFSLMAFGSYNGEGKRPPYLNAKERDMLGWMGSDELKELDLTQSKYTLAPIQTNKAYSSPTKTANEYFLYEFRNGTGWDSGLKKGLIIYHVDQSNNKVGNYTASSLWNSNDINCYSEHQCMDLIEATPSYEPFGNTVHSFTSTTEPAAKDWAGNATGYDLTNISYTNECATFNLPDEEDIPDATLRKYDSSGQSKYGLKGEASLYAGVKYNNDELDAYQGYIIKSISLKINKTVCGSVTLFVRAGNKMVLEKVVTDQVSSDKLTEIDISSDNVRIPSSGDLIFGYKVTSRDNSGFKNKDKPCYVNNGVSSVSGGGLYSKNGSSWSNIGSNLIVSASLAADKLSFKGITYIDGAKSSYKAGDAFVLSAVKSPSRPYESVSWTVNSESKDDGATITLQKGVTTIKAKVSYRGGISEVIEMNINID